MPCIIRWWDEKNRKYRIACRSLILLNFAEILYVFVNFLNRRFFSCIHNRAAWRPKHYHHSCLSLLIIHHTIWRRCIWNKFAFCRKAFHIIQLNGHLLYFTRSGSFKMTHYKVKFKVTNDGNKKVNCVKVQVIGIYAYQTYLTSWGQKFKGQF